SLAHWPGLEGLRSLALPESALRDGGMVELARAFTDRLLELDLGKNGVDARGVRELVASAAVRSLVRLDLSGNPIGREGAATLADSPELAELRFLDLSQAGIDAGAAEVVLRWQRLGDLAELKLDRNDLRETEDIWYDQGTPVGSTPADPVVA